REQEIWQQSEARAKIAKAEAFQKEFEARTGIKIKKPDVLREEPYFFPFDRPFNVTAPSYNNSLSPTNHSPLGADITTRVMTHKPNALASSSTSAPTSSGASIFKNSSATPSSSSSHGDSMCSLCNRKGHIEENCREIA
ncbi:hypothetical protein CVT24_010089, partial [Panaeolus cyanescens]